MSAVKEKLVSFSEHEHELGNTQQILESIIAAKQDQLRTIVSAISREDTILSTKRNESRQALGKLQGELTQRKEVFEKELANERAEQGLRRKELDDADRTITLRNEEVNRLEAKSAEIRSLHNQTIQERMAIERQRVRADELKERAETLQIQVNDTQQTLIRQQDSVKQQQEQLTNQTKVQQAKEGDLVQREESVALDLENLKALREEIDPKIKELASQEEGIRANTERAESLHKETNQRLAETQQAQADLQGLLQRFHSYEGQLIETRAKLDQVRLELDTKTAQLKVHGVDVEKTPEIPELPTGERKKKK